MKKYILIFASFLLFGLVSCNKTESNEVFSPVENQEMTFGITGDGINISYTKVAEVSEVSSVYWMPTSGTIASDTKVYDPTLLELADSKFKTGKMWPAESVSYNYYVSNESFSWNAETFTATINAQNTKDIVAMAQAVTYKSSPEIVVEHIFARTGSLTLTPETGYELSGDPVWKIKSVEGGTAGKYDIGRKSWDDLTPLAQTEFTSTSDLYLVPGTYKVEISYTLKKGDYVEPFSKEATVTFAAGKIHNLSATAHTGGAGATDIVLTVTVKDWSEKNIVIPVSDLV